MNRRRTLALAIATPLIALAPMPAWAYFGAASGTGAVTGKVATDSLGVPTVSGSQVGSTATVKVTAAPTSGPTPAGYRVDRISPSAQSAVCSITGSTGQCNDTGAASTGSNQYAVFAKLGTNWVASNSASVSTTATSDTFVVSAAGSVTVGVAYQLTITANVGGSSPAVTDTSFSGTRTILVSGALNGPDGSAPTLPVQAVFTNGVAVVNVTLTDAAPTSLTVSVGGVAAPPVTVSVGAGAPARLAFTGTSVVGGTLAAGCYYLCTLPSLGGNGGSFTAKVSVTDAFGNVVSNVGSGVTVALASNPAPGTGNLPTLSPTSLAIPATGAATSSSTFTYTSQTGNWNSRTSDSVTASSGTYANAVATLTK